MKLKVIAVNILLIVLFNNLSAQESDAIIKINNENYEYSFEDGNVFSESKTIYRKIKINSEYAREQLNKLYIPTFEDLDFSFSLISLEASTIKKNGRVYKVPNESIKETTLPANVPFLYGYDGNVKMLAFVNLEVGDEIEYKYTVIYRTSSSYDYMNIMRTKFVTLEYPIESAEYKIHLKNDLQFKGYPKNIKENFTETIVNKKEKSYCIILNNISGNEIDRFASAYDFPFFYYRIFRKKNYDPLNSWDDFVDNITFKSKKKESIFSGKTIQDIKKVAEKQNGVINQVNSIKEQISGNIKSNVYNLLAQNEYFEPDMRDANQLLRLFSLLGIKSSLILVKNKFKGDIIDEFISVAQFDDFLIKFFDEQGNTYYMYFFAPLYEINEIPYQYHGTRALKVENIDGNYEFSFMDMPEQKFTSNQKTTEYHYSLQNADSILKFNAEMKVHASGAYSQLMRIGFIAEKLDTNGVIDIFSENVKDDFYNVNYDINIDTIILGEYNGDINYSVNFDLTKRNYNPPNILSFEVSEFIDLNSILQSLKKKNRSSNAYFNFPYNKKVILKITANNSYSFLNNELLDFKEVNEIASIQTKHKVIDNMLEIDIEFSLLKDVCSEDKWNSFVKLNQELEDFLKSKIVIIQKL